MKRILIILLIVLAFPQFAQAQEMTCAEYLEMRQGDVDFLAEQFDTSANNVGEMLELYIVLYTMRHRYEDMEPPECAIHLHDLMIAQVAANQDVAGLALNPLFDEERIRDEMGPIGERIQRLRGEVQAEVERIEQKNE